MSTVGTPPDDAATPPQGEHELPERHLDQHDNRLLYAILGVLAVALTVIAVVSYAQHQDNKLAEQKATQLEALFRHVGLPLPADRSVIVQALGTDGGAVCATAGKDLPAAILDQQLVAGGGGVGARPIRVDRAILDGELAIIAVYCPSRASDFVKYFRDYKVDDVIRD